MALRPGQSLSTRLGHILAFSDRLREDRGLTFLTILPRRGHDDDNDIMIMMMTR